MTCNDVELRRPHTKRILYMDLSEQQNKLSQVMKTDNTLLDYVT